MRKLSVFNSVSLDGYFTDENSDMSWAHKNDPEWNAFLAGNATGGGMLLFGRITYQLMMQYWPTEQAMKYDPVVAKQMNDLPKIVFSRTLDKADWSHTKLIQGNLAAEVLKLKKESSADMTILGSGSIVAQLAGQGLIDEYNIIVCPIVLGKGRTVFQGLNNRFTLKLTNSRAFKNGSVLLSYSEATVNSR